MTHHLLSLSLSLSLSPTASSFKPHLIPTSVGVELSLRLPALFPSSFSLIIHYYDDSETLVGKSPLVSPSFANTRSVDYVITADKLPSVTVFLARVQVVAMEMEGELSEISNLISEFWTETSFRSSLSYYYYIFPPPLSHSCF